MKQNRGFTANPKTCGPAPIRLLALLLALAITLVFGATASADEFPMTPEAAQEALEEGKRVQSQLTDSKAAEELPHKDLERTQVLHLLSAVFGNQVEGVAGIFNDLDVDHFLSDNAAVIDAGDQPEASGPVIGDGHYEGPALLESTVPLRTEDQSGEEATVDLGLEHAEGEIQPADPLVEVGIPSELGEGIELPESKVGIELMGAPQERAPSIVDQTVAVYPEVAEDTSFAVAPSPTGVETFTLLQSPDAPNSATYQLSLPGDASLVATEDGGAEVSASEQSMLRIFPPAAMDAEGNSVPVSLAVLGNSFTVKAEPQGEAAYPILVDPTIESHNWYGYQSSDGLSAWQGSSNAPGLDANKQNALGVPGTDLRAVNGYTLPYNAKAHWAYSVPRYESDLKEFGLPPTSYISSMVLTNLFFITKDNSGYPMMAAGIWNPSVNNWVSVWGHGGNEGNLEHLEATYTFSTANEDAKQAIDNEFWVGAAHTMTSDRESYVGSATVELADKVAPKIGSFAPPEKWVNQTGPGIPFAFIDTGLGISEILVTDVSDHKTTKTDFFGCLGTVSSMCPRLWSDDGKTTWTHIYDPSTLSQGIRKMTAVAKDPVGNASVPYEFSLKIDHTAPKVELSGTAVNQTQFQRPRYTVVATDFDGTTTEPQSGVASTEISVDGKKVDSTAAGCPTQNCSLKREWILKSDEYAVGKHTIVVKATDGVGLTTEKTLSVTIERDKTPPEIIKTSGALVNAPSGWIEQKAYEIKLLAGDAGYGVTSVAFKMDGTVVNETKGTCLDGNCQYFFEAKPNMAIYKGGAHPAELIVRDGAGNVTKRAWTVNVDPKGEVSLAEAVDTMEAVEDTTESTPIAPTYEVISSEERAEGNDPGLEKVEGGFQSTGTPADSMIPSEPSKGVTLESADGSIKIIEMGAASGSPPSIASEVASVDPNTGTQVDSVVRPIYNGDQGFKVIRDVTAPTKYSWKLLLNAGQKLEQVDSQDVAVFWGNGDRALLINAEQAHDATGKEVPTELTAEGSDVITLTVKHTAASFVYPILAGPSFQSSYTEVIVWDPQLEREVAEAEAQAEAERIEIEHQAPRLVPIPDPEPEAGASVARRTHVAEYGMRKCQTYYLCFPGAWEAHLEEAFLYNGIEHVTGGQAWHDNEISYHHCNNYSSTEPWSITINDCLWINNHVHYYRENAHYMCSQDVFHVNNHVTSEYHAMTFHNFGDGYAKGHQDNKCQALLK
jgi:hypothetical protein